ncbi:hypothetical protein EJ04DRAFT_357584 [Polyplosphaeria fusca]|uniref:RNase III domain-containing protein n=1 Tax=Polyplosphaeria fusca TaxID=682080 RepID=A0A9P4V7I1_9PLEO|nr:hypothetical protein EJ04DRAFT_357584 [Polyplosphaeria fusca]
MHLPKLRYGPKFLLWPFSDEYSAGPLLRYVELLHQYSRLFDRFDMFYHDLFYRRLQWTYSPPPPVFHDLLDVMTKVYRAELILDYKFKNRGLCIEALKMSNPSIPLHFHGNLYYYPHNNRLALVGDKVLYMALVDHWYDTKRTLGEYSEITIKSVTRVKLAEEAREVRLASLVIHTSLTESEIDSRIDLTAKTYEALLGAVYIDVESN